MSGCVSSGIYRRLVAVSRCYESRHCSLPGTCNRLCSQSHVSTRPARPYVEIRLFSSTFFLLRRMPEKRTVAIGVSGVCQFACLSRGFAAPIRLGGSRACLWCRLLGSKKFCFRRGLRFSITDSMRPSPSDFGHLFERPRHCTFAFAYYESGELRCCEAGETEACRQWCRQSLTLLHGDEGHLMSDDKVVTRIVQRCGHIDYSVCIHWLTLSIHID